MGQLLKKEGNFFENHFAIKYRFLCIFWKKAPVSANAQNKGSIKKNRNGDLRDGRGDLIWASSLFTCLKVVHQLADITNESDLPLWWGVSLSSCCSCWVIKYLQTQRAKLMPLVTGTCSGRRGAEGRRQAMPRARRCRGSTRRPGCSVTQSCRCCQRHEKYVSLPAPKCGAIVMACHQLPSGAMKYPSINIFITVYDTTTKYPISPVDLLIYCPAKPGVKAWSLFYLFY